MIIFITYHLDEEISEKGLFHSSRCRRINIRRDGIHYFDALFNELNRDGQGHNKDRFLYRINSSNVFGYYSWSGLKAKHVAVLIKCIINYSEINNNESIYLISHSETLGKPSISFGEVEYNTIIKEKGAQYHADRIKVIAFTHWPKNPVFKLLNNVQSVLDKSDINTNIEKAIVQYINRKLT